MKIKYYLEHIKSHWNLHVKQVTKLIVFFNLLIRFFRKLFHIKTILATSSYVHYHIFIDQLFLLIFTTNRTSKTIKWLIRIYSICAHAIPVLVRTRDSLQLLSSRHLQLIYGQNIMFPKHQQFCKSKDSPSSDSVLSSCVRSRLLSLLFL